MKKTALSLLLLLFITLGLAAKQKTIENPAYEFKSTGISNVTKVELTDTATLLTLHITFVPHWWITCDGNDFIRDCATGVEYKIKKIRGGVFNEQIWMGASGDSTFILEFPPLPTSVKKIDYSEGVFGISLDPAKAGKRKPAEVSPAIDKWIKAELAKAPKKTLANYNTPEFFTDAPARLIGCIKGYDRRAGFSTGIVYASNELTRDDYPIVVQIQPDGRFEAEIPLNTPKCSWLIFYDRFVFPYYIEPGQTLSMILDWDEFLTFDRRRNIRYQFENIEFRGPLASLNNELLNYKADELNWDEFEKKRNTMPPMSFKASQLKELDNHLARFTEYLKNNKISDKAQTLLRNNILVGNYKRLFDYAMNRDYYAKQDTANAVLKMPIPNDYYNFLKDIDLNDQGLLVTQEFSSFINRYEYCELFQKAQSDLYRKNNSQIIKPSKTFLEYLNDEKIVLTEAESKYFEVATKMQISEEDMAALKLMEDVYNAFYEKYKEQNQKYYETYIAPILQQRKQVTEIDIWKAKDSVLINNLCLQPNLAYEISKVRSLNYHFKSLGSKEKASELWSFLQKGITTPYLLATGNRLLKEAYPEEQIASIPLPTGTATDIFRKIIDPFKGKVLFIDFWATTCAPCVSGIKSMKETRAKYASNPDFDFIFITDERSSPEKPYTDFVKEQELKNVYRLPKDDFNFLRQLFKFNGIPRYVVIDQKGNVINSDFAMHNFQSELGKILPAYK